MDLRIKIKDKIFTVPTKEDLVLEFDDKGVWSTDFELPLTLENITQFGVTDLYSLEHLSSIPVQLFLNNAVYDGVLHVDAMNVHENRLKCWLEVTEKPVYDELVKNGHRTLLDMYINPLQQTVPDYDPNILPIDMGCRTYGGSYNPFMNYFSTGNLRTITENAGYNTDNLSAEELDRLEHVYPVAAGVWGDKSCKIKKVYIGERYVDYTNGITFYHGNGLYAGWKDDELSIEREDRLAQNSSADPLDYRVPMLSRSVVRMKFTTAPTSEGFDLYQYWGLSRMSEDNNPIYSDYDYYARTYYGRTVQESRDNFRHFILKDHPILTLDFDPDVEYIVSNKPFSVRRYWDGGYVDSYTGEYIAKTYVAKLPLNSFRAGQNVGKLQDFHDCTTNPESQTGTKVNIGTTYQDCRNNVGRGKDVIIQGSVGEQQFEIVKCIFAPAEHYAGYAGLLTFVPRDSETGIVPMPDGKTNFFNVEYDLGRVTGYPGYIWESHYSKNTFTGYTTMSQFREPQTWGNYYGYGGGFRIVDCPHLVTEPSMDQYKDYYGLWFTTKEAQLGDNTLQNLLNLYNITNNSSLSVNGERKSIVNEYESLVLSNHEPVEMQIKQWGRAYKVLNNWNNTDKDENIIGNSENVVEVNGIILNYMTMQDLISSHTGNQKIYGTSVYGYLLMARDGLVNNVQQYYKPFLRVAAAPNVPQNGIISTGMTTNWYRHIDGVYMLNYGGGFQNFIEYNYGLRNDQIYTMLMFRSEENLDLGTVVKVNTRNWEVIEKEQSDGAFQYVGVPR